MPTVLHLVPYDTVGGVETAVRSLPAQWDGPAGQVRLRRAYLVTHSPVARYPGDWHGPSASVNHPTAHWRLMRFARRSRADLVVASLWRCCPALIVLKALQPSIRTAVFLHSAVDAHLPDRILSRAAMLASDEIWTDSRSTLEARVPPGLRERARVFSFLTERPPERLTPVVPDGAGSVPPCFVFWGRLQYEKHLERAIEVFAAIYRLLPEARFDIIGPDRGVLPVLRDKVAEHALEHAVTFVGALPHHVLLRRAHQYRFYLQTSRFEGMAMSVMEAMALGLVPVVTPVGEIPRYCPDGDLGIHVGTPEDTARRVAALVADPLRWQKVSARAAGCWTHTRLFRDDYREACDRLLLAPRSGKVR
jgi:glycosyltransferase involved in cell wall biosynthesis